MPWAGGPWGTSIARRRRFWTVAAKVNSSLAPLSPRRRNRSNLRMVFRCANSISTFLRSQRDRWYCSVVAICLAVSRAASCTLRTILRIGVFGQQRGFIGQFAQSCLLRSVDDRAGLGDVRAFDLERAPLAAQGLALRAAVLGGLFVPGEVAAGERAVFALGAVPHRHVRFDPLLDYPAQHLCSAVAGITDQALRRQAVLLLDALDHLHDRGISAVRLTWVAVRSRMIPCSTSIR